MLLRNLKETVEWNNFKPPKFMAIVTYPMYKSHTSLQMDFRRENGNEKKVEKWLLEENVIPKMEMEHEEDLKRKDREIRSL